MADVAGLDHPAIFGKLPGHGDFISRGFSGARRDAIDLWLSDWLAAAQDQCGPAFVDEYEVAAPWLFEGSHATAVLMPSMDAVGRRFPLLVISAADRTTQAIYDAMVDALAEGQGADDLRGALAALAAVTPAGDRSLRWFLPEGADPRLPMPDSVASWHAVEGCFV
jgi:type VI secretion system protein ImpM